MVNPGVNRNMSWRTRRAHHVNVTLEIQCSNSAGRLDTLRSVATALKLHPSSQEENNLSHSCEAHSAISEFIGFDVINLIFKWR